MFNPGSGHVPELVLGPNEKAETSDEASVDLFENFKSVSIN